MTQTEIPRVNIEDLLREQLAPTLRRERWLRRWQAYGVCAAAAVTAAVALQVVQERFLWDARAPWLLLLLAVAALGVKVHRHLRRRTPDLHAVALQIERRQPELRAVLLTAVAQQQAAAAGRLGYLQEQVMAAALRQAAPEVWARAVSSRALWGTGAGVAAMAAIFVYLQVGALAPGWSRSFLPDQYGPTVTPGDTEVERGTNVLILARFGKTVPSRATLVVRASGKSAESIVLTKNLDDPVFGGLTPPIADDRVDYVIEYAGERTRRFRITSYDLPDLESVDARIAYPGQAEDKAIKDVHHLSVVKGARVTLTFTLNKPVADARLVAGDAALSVAPAGQRADVRVVTLTPDKTQRYELVLVDDKGRKNRLPPTLTIEVHDNLPPQITVTFPGRDVRPSPIEEVSLEAKVIDDVGLSAYGISYRLNDADKEIRLGGRVASSREQEVRHVLALETLGAKPDDVLSYHFWAEDVGSDGKTRRISSDLYFAEVRPFEEIYREGAASQGASDPSSQPPSPPGDANDLIERQRDVMNATWKVQREADLGTDVWQDVATVAKGQDDTKVAAEAGRENVSGARASSALESAIKKMGVASAHLARAAKDHASAEFSPALAAEQDAFAALLKLRPREHSVTRGRPPGARGGGQGQAQRQAELQGLELKQEESRYEAQQEATAENTAAAEDRQIVSRLKELARRQKSMSEKIKELQVALQEAKKKEQQDELQHQLKRLREEQQALAGDMDELLARMNSPENRARTGEAQAQVERSRARAQEVADALTRGETPRALGASTRAERELGQLRDTLQRKVSDGFAREIREARDQAQKLEDDQRKLSEQVASSTDKTNPDDNRRLANATRGQQKGTAALLEKMRVLSESAEASAPLLSRKLYDALRRARTGNVERALETSSDLLDRNMPGQAQPLGEQARKGLGELRQGVEDAAKGVLGDETEALRLAKNEIDGLLNEVQKERAQGPAQGPQGQRQGQAAGGANAGRGLAQEGPITGEGFRAWTDRLRDVEELLGDARLRTDAGRIRDSARALRAEFKRHALSPQGPALDLQLIAPLVELRDNVSDDLRRAQPADKVTPIDRDPVPARFSDLVRRYYKSLADGK